MHWYVIHTKPNQEQSAVDALSDRLVTWLPLARIRTIKKIRGNPKPVWVERAFWPRYAFVHAWPRQLRLVRNCKAISGIVMASHGGNDDGPPPTYATIPDPIMAVIQAGFDPITDIALAKAAQSKARFKAAQQVKLLTGPFADAFLKVAQDEGDFVRVLINMLGAERELRVPTEQLEAA